MCSVLPACARFAVWRETVECALCALPDTLLTNSDFGGGDFGGGGFAAGGGGDTSFGGNAVGGGGGFDAGGTVDYGASPGGGTGGGSRRVSELPTRSTALFIPINS